MTTRIHLDTDLAGDTDDLCALAMLLGRPDVELTGITTVSEHDGLRAGCVAAALALAGRADVPVAAGAGGSLGGFQMFPGVEELGRYWPMPITPQPSPAGAALDLIARSIEQGATIVAIGPWTNLALCEVMRPGSLADAEIVLMGGYIQPPRPGLPAWGPAMDYNVQQDTLAAQIVMAGCRPTVVPMPLGLEAGVQASHLPRLRRGGALAQLLAHQAEQHGAQYEMSKLCRAAPAVPVDTLNFQFDVLACAVAAGWPSIRVEELRLRWEIRDGLFTWSVTPGGTAVRVATALDEPAFTAMWLDAVAPESPHRNP